MLRYACLSGLGISQDLKIDLTTLLSDWSTSLISGYKLGMVKIGISVSTEVKRKQEPVTAPPASFSGRQDECALPERVGFYPHL